MKHYKLALIASVFCISLNACSQNDTTQTVQDTIIELPPLKPDYTFRKLAEGLEICVTDAPKRSIVGDSKLTIVKLKPSVFDFFLLTASEYDRKQRTVEEWADTFQLNMAVNAGMYELSDKMTNRGFMKNYGHYNNTKLRPGYNSMIALNPKDTLDPFYAILDLQCDQWEKVKSDYNCYAQGMRMIDCSGQALGWNKKNQSCSMLIAATDPYGNIYYVFTRSPYTHNEMIQFMKQMPYELTNAIYIEGGPETSMYICVGQEEIIRIGSYVSGTYPTDDNNEFWAIPNVIGMRLKKQPE